MAANKNVSYLHHLIMAHWSCILKIHMHRLVVLTGIFPRIAGGWLEICLSTDCFKENRREVISWAALLLVIQWNSALRLPRWSFKPQCRNAYSPHCPPSIYEIFWENLLKHQVVLSLVLVSFILSWRARLLPICDNVNDTITQHSNPVITTKVSFSVGGRITRIAL